MAIVRFRDQYRFLSNFYPAFVKLDGEPYPTVEHAYQAAKTDDPHQRKAIRESALPGRAKRLGRLATLRPDWDRIKVPVMSDLLEQKFSDPQLAKLLLATGDEELIEGNDWGDTFWGVCRGVGENWLGRLLMQRRQILKLNQGKING